MVDSKRTNLLDKNNYFPHNVYGGVIVMNYTIINSDYLAHHGIKGQKWGVRRFQNEDGSLTEAGSKRYSVSNYSSAGSYKRALKRLDKDAVNEQAAYKKHAIKSDEYGIKAYKAKMNGDDKKADKYAEKSTKEAILRDEHEKNVKNLDSQTWKTIAKASEMGFDVAMKQTPTLNRGMKAAASMFGVAGTLVTAPIAAAKSSKYRKYGYEYMNDGHKISVKRGTGAVSVG